MPLMNPKKPLRAVPQPFANYSTKRNMPSTLISVSVAGKNAISVS